MGMVMIEIVAHAFTESFEGKNLTQKTFDNFYPPETSHIPLLPSLGLVTLAQVSEVCPQEKRS